MWLDEILQRAHEEGLFDNLPYQGQRLPLYTNPYEPAHLRSAHRIIKQAGLTLPWIAERKAIEADTISAVQNHGRAYDWYLQQGQTPASRKGYDAACDRFRKQVESLNKRIRDFNLKAPDAQVHLRHLQPERLLRKIEKQQR